MSTPASFASTTKSPPLNAADRRRLRGALWVATGAILGMLVLTGASAWLWLAPDAASMFDRGRRWLFTGLVVLWLWLLRRQPLRWIRILADLRAGRAREATAVSTPTWRRGIGILAPLHARLPAGGRMLDADGIPPEHLHPGQEVIVRSAPHAGLVLDVRLSPAAAASDPEALTAREREMLALLARGLPDKLIARELDLSPGTVRTYNTILYRKLGARSRNEAIEHARQRGLLPVD